MVNKLLINFTCLENDSVFGFALETGASRAGNFCCPAQVIFVAQAGRKFRLFSLTLQRYKNFKALPNFQAIILQFGNYKLQITV